MIALAGMVGQDLWSQRVGLRPPDYEDMLLDLSAMSPADWALTDCESRYWTPKLLRSAEDAVRLLREPLWGPLRQTARTLFRLRIVTTAP